MRSTAFVVTLLAGIGATSAAHAAAQLACSNTLKETHVFYKHGKERSAGPGTGNFNAGTRAEVAVEADCASLDAAVSASMTTKLFGAVEVKPFEVVLAAHTKSNNHNTVEVSVLAFGEEVWQAPIADSVQPLRYSKSVGYTLPAGELDFGWGDTVHDPVFDGELAVDASINTVASYGGWILLDVAPDGVEVRTMAAINAKGTIDATAMYTYGGVSVPFLNLTTGLKIATGSIAGRAVLAPKNATTWTAEAGYQVAVHDVLGGRLTVKLPDPEILDPGHTKLYDLFYLYPRAFDGAWDYATEFTKPQPN